jgi:alpha-galactosidase
MAFRAAVALPGHFGVELDVRRLDAAARAELEAWIALYKQWRGHLHRGRVWRGGSATDAADQVVWQAHGDEAAHELLLLVYRVAPSSHRYTPPLRLPMLDRAARYRLREVEAATSLGRKRHDTSAPFLDALRDDGEVVDGAWLAEVGLPLPRAKAETAFIVHLQRC